MRDSMKIVSGGSIQVGRHVEAAELRAAEDIRIEGGVAGKEKGRCIAGRDFRAGHVNNAHVEAGGDVSVATEITHGHVACGGRLRISGGTLLALHVTALGGIECGVLGSTAGVQTIVETGVDDLLRRRAATQMTAVQVKRQRIAKTRQSIEPLLRHQKALTAEQKEKATELLFEASDMEEAISEEVRELLSWQSRASAKACCEVRVEQAIHPGVVIRFPGVEAAVTATIAGPMRISPCRERGELRVKLELLDGSERVQWLESRGRCDEAMAMLERELAQPK